MSRYFRPAVRPPTVTKAPAKPPPPRDRRQLSRDADVRLFVGSTGSGKTHALRAALKGWRGRVIAWDWKAEFVEYPLASSLPDLIRRLRQGARGVRYVPAMIRPPGAESKFKTARDWVDWQFAMFCRICWTVQEADPETDLAMIVEEASEVVRAGFAPEWWSRIVSQGRVLGFSLFVLAQRPTMIDSTTRSNSTWVRCGRLQFPDDARAMGMMVNKHLAEIMGLPRKHAFVFDGYRTTYTAPDGEAPVCADSSPEKQKTTRRRKAQSSGRTV